MENESISLQIKNSNSENFTVAITGRLDFQTIAELWNKALEIQQQYLPNNLIIDASGINYCDGAGIGLLLELSRRQRQADKKIEIIGLSSKLQKLLDLSAQTSAVELPQKKCPRNFIISIGAMMFSTFSNVRENIYYIGIFSYYLFYSLLRPRTIRWKDFWKTIDDVGPKAFLLVALIGFLVGLISAFQAAIPLEQFGVQLYIANLVGIGLLKEMGPLMAAILLAGRTASSFAAEIGTMKINQEVDALTTMGLEPVRFLAVPKILATILMTPLLNMFLIVFGLIGCGVVMKSLGYNIHIYVNQLQSAVHIQDFVSGMVKTFVFGLVIACIGCMHGLKTRFGASAVGYSTTQAVVTSIIMIVFIDGIFAVVYYVLGI